MKWCKENICPLLERHNVVMVKENCGNNSCWDMHLMTHCKDLIIANSSFSWWGAYLNQREDHITYCPNKWHNTMEYKDHYVNGWIKIDIK